MVNGGRQLAPGEKKAPFRGSDLILRRLKTDATLEPHIPHFSIGYLDRFLGIVELPLAEFKHVHDDRDGVPLHRIRYFKLRGVRVWDREQRLDVLTHQSDLEGEVMRRTQAGLASPPRQRPPRRGRGRRHAEEDGDEEGEGEGGRGWAEEGDRELGEEEPTAAVGEPAAEEAATEALPQRTGAERRAARRAARRAEAEAAVAGRRHEEEEEGGD